MKRFSNTRLGQGSLLELPLGKESLITTDFSEKLRRESRNAKVQGLRFLWNLIMSRLKRAYSILGKVK